MFGILIVIVFIGMVIKFNVDEFSEPTYRDGFGNKAPTVPPQPDEKGMTLQEIKAKRLREYKEQMEKDEKEHQAELYEMYLEWYGYKGWTEEELEIEREKIYKELDEKIDNGILTYDEKKRIDTINNAWPMANDFRISGNAGWYEHHCSISYVDNIGVYRY